MMMLANIFGSIQKHICGEILNYQKVAFLKTVVHCAYREKFSACMYVITHTNTNTHIYIFIYIYIYILVTPF